MLITIFLFAKNNDHRVTIFYYENKKKKPARVFFDIRELNLVRS